MNFGSDLSRSYTALLRRFHAKILAALTGDSVATSESSSELAAEVPWNFHPSEHETFVKLACALHPGGARKCAVILITLRPL
jgi:hypothetical protein